MGKKSIFEPLRITRRCNYTVWPQIVFKAWRSSGVLGVATGNRLTAGGRTHEGHTSIKKRICLTIKINKRGIVTASHQSCVKQQKQLFSVALGANTGLHSATAGHLDSVLYLTIVTDVCRQIRRVIRTRFVVPPPPLPTSCVSVRTQHKPNTLRRSMEPLYSRDL